MLKINSARVQAVAAAAEPEELHPHLQAAIELEHATIPLYLTAFFSIKPGFMPEISGILKSVFVEEMLHMAVACNILNAIKGIPVLNKPEFIPKYPGPLPMNISHSLEVHLAPLSLEQVKLFMDIEEPDDPLEFPVKAALPAVVPSYATIGQFYQTLIDKIREMGDGVFQGDPARQVVNTHVD